MWAVGDGDDLYVRSVNGRDSAWFRGTRTTRRGRISTRGTARDIEFVDVDDAELSDRLDAAYRAKYARYAGPTAHITSPAARAATLRLIPS